MSLQGKRVIVTGSHGFLGAHLVPRLAEAGAEVLAMDVSTGTDITDWEQLKGCRGVDVIYHLAAKTYIPQTAADPRETYRVNLAGTLNMLEVGRLNGVRSFIFASSYVYGQPQYLPTDEKHPVNPATPYNRSKALGEELCRIYAEDYGLKCVVLRAFNIYGRGQGESFLIPTILGQIAGGEIRLRDAAPRRDLLYVEDAVAAYLKAAAYAGAGFEVFNIGLGKSYSVAEIVRKICDATGREVKISYLHNRRENEVMDTVADISKAREKLDWEPKFDLEAGLAEMMADRQP